MKCLRLVLLVVLGAVLLLALPSNSGATEAGDPPGCMIEPWHCSPDNPECAIPEGCPPKEEGPFCAIPEGCTPEQPQCMIEPWYCSPEDPECAIPEGCPPQGEGPGCAIPEGCLPPQGPGCAIPEGCPVPARDEVSPPPPAGDQATPRKKKRCGHKRLRPRPRRACLRR